MSILESLPVQRVRPVLLLPFFNRTLLDSSGYGNNSVASGSTVRWRSIRGVDHLDFSGSGLLTVADSSELQLTAGTLIIMGEFDNYLSNDNIISKRDAGGVNYHLNLASSSAVGFYDGSTISTLTFGWPGAKSLAFSVGAVAKPKAYRDGVFAAEGNNAITLSTNDAPLIIGNYYAGSNPQSNPLKCVMIYDEALTADEISKIYSWGQEQTSPQVPQDRRYFDTGSLVPNGPETQYGPEGPDLVVDGDMEAVGTAAWTDVAGTSSKQSGSPSGSGTQVLRLTKDGAPTGGTWQETTVIGSLYRARGWMRSDATSTPRIGWESGYYLIGTPSVSWQYFDFVFVALGTKFYAYATGGIAGNWAEFDVISCEQNNNLLSDGDMEADGVDEYITSGVGVLTKSTDDPYEGLQAIRCTATGAGDGAVRQDGKVVIGKKYRITAQGRGTATNLSLTAPASMSVIPSLTTAWQLIDVTVTALNDIVAFRNGAGMAGGQWYEIDQLLVREVFENVISYDFGNTVLGTVIDKSGNGNDGTMVGSVSPVHTEVGKALSFDGVSSHVTYTAGSEEDYGTGDFSYEFLAYTTDISAVQIFIGGNDNNNQEFHIRMWSSNIQVEVNGGAESVATTTSPLTNGVWAHIVVTRVSGTLYIYVDGKEEKSGASTGDLDLSSNSRSFGSRRDGSGNLIQLLEGGMANCRIYNRTLTPAEISADYKKFAQKLMFHEDMSQVRPTLVDES